MSDTGYHASKEANNSDDTTLLASLGYKQELRREFTTLEMFGFGFSVAAVVPSIASVLYYSLPNGGPSAMVWGWATSSVFIMFIALSMAELSSVAPTSGGLYYWTYKYSSPKYRNILCWMVGYTNTITYISGVAGVGWSCATALMAAASIGSDGSFIPTVHQTYGVYIAVLVTFAFIASCATRVLARFQNTLIALNLALVLLMVIGLPAATPTELKNSAKYAFGNFDNATLWPSGFAFILSFLAPLWSISGFDSGVHISEEARNANVAVPWAIVYAVAVGTSTGFAVQIALAFCMGTDTINILSSPVQQPMATILLNSFGKKGMLAAWSFIFLSLFLSGVGLLISSSRQIFAFSRDGALIFARFLYNINSITGTPVRCVWFSVTCAALLGLTAFAGPAATGAIFSLGVVGQYVANSIPIAARYLGGQEFKRGPFHLGTFSMPIAIIAVLWMWFMTVVLMFPSAPGPVAQTMNYTVVCLGGVLLLALGYYYFPRHGGVYWFRGPVANIDLEPDRAKSPLGEKDDEST
ncbi:APC amino acid permease [Mycena maculata]|uniref:APC amino acid permease n=1 Tax=Mycena maculata TaxID=230809 RepID=A0AAD7II42_9AGAR|nr:APC amino acid permease [Mycena maculata]